MTRLSARKRKLGKTQGTRAGRLVVEEPVMMMLQTGMTILASVVAGEHMTIVTKALVEAGVKTRVRTLRLAIIQLL